MKDEIKEILENPKILMLSYGNYVSLDDYTNLQESEAYYYGQYKDYKSRNEKAKDKIKQLKEERKTLYKYTPEKDLD